VSTGAGAEEGTVIRLTAMLRRNAALTPEEFRAHWATAHAEVIRATPGVADRVVRYEQHPRLALPGGWTGSDGFDGVTVQWFRSADDFGAMLRDPGYQADVSPDERRLLDLDNSVFLLTDEPRVIIGG
jgi:hypothetical protein